MPPPPIFLVAGKATAPRTGRLARQSGWDGTKNLAQAQALALRKDQKKIQRGLTKAAIDEANRRVKNAMHGSGVMPKFMYRMDFRPVHVVGGVPWHGLRPSQLQRQPYQCIAVAL